MRNTKLALTFGIMTLAIHGCGDSGGAGTKKDSGLPDGAAVTTKNDASTGTDANTSTQTSTLTSTSTATKTSTSIDAQVANPDTAIPSPIDGGAKLDGALIAPEVDGGTKIDGSAKVDVGGAVDLGARMDGSAAPDAPAKTDGPTSAGTCTYPACLDSLAKDCDPQGACVQQVISPSIGTTGSFSTSITSCYDNGVKMQIASTYSFDLSNLTGTTVTSFRNATRLCYTMETPYSLTTPTTVTSTIKSPSGSTVGTITVDSTANTQTITCSGQSPVVLPLNCGSSTADAGSSAACATGTCAF